MRGCRPLTNFEIQRLFDLLSAQAWRRERVLITLGIRSGLRFTSLLSLRVGYVAIAGEVPNRIRVRRGTVKGRWAWLRHAPSPPSRRRCSGIPRLPPKPSAHRLRLPGSAARTPAQSDGRMEDDQGGVAAGIVGTPGEIGAHTLRKTFARLIYAALDHDLVRTCYAMRHASMATTVEYLYFREEEVDRAILAL